MKKGDKYINERGVVVIIIDGPDALGQVTYKFIREDNGCAYCHHESSVKNMLRINGYKPA